MSEQLMGEQDFAHSTDEERATNRLIPEVSIPVEMKADLGRGVECFAALLESLPDNSRVGVLTVARSGTFMAAVLSARYPNLIQDSQEVVTGTHIVNQSSVDGGDMELFRLEGDSDFVGDLYEEMDTAYARYLQVPNVGDLDEFALSVGESVNSAVHAIQALGDVDHLVVVDDVADTHITMGVVTPWILTKATERLSGEEVGLDLSHKHWEFDKTTRTYAETPGLENVSRMCLLDPSLEAWKGVVVRGVDFVSLMNDEALQALDFMKKETYQHAALQAIVFDALKGRAMIAGEYLDIRSMNDLEKVADARMVYWLGEGYDRALNPLRIMEESHDIGALLDLNRQFAQQLMSVGEEHKGNFTTESGIE